MTTAAGAVLGHHRLLMKKAVAVVSSKVCFIHDKKS